MTCLTLLKVRVKLSCPVDAVKAGGGSRSIVPLIHNLSTRWTLRKVGTGVSSFLIRIKFISSLVKENV